MRNKSIQINVAVNCIIKRKNKYLLVQQARPEKAKGKWNLPGGKVDIGESFSDALIREVKEEVGLDVIKYSYIGCKHEFPQETLKHFFIVSVFKGIIKFPKDELVDAKWFTIKEIENIKNQLRKK